MKKEGFLKKWEVCFQNRALKAFKDDLDALLAGEREACAKIADSYSHYTKRAEQIAQAIRSGGTER